MRLSLSSKGFSLVELLIAVSIFSVAIALTVCLVSVVKPKRSQEASCMASSLSQVEASLKLFSAAKGSYPSSSCPLPAPLTEVCVPDLIPDWLNSVPLPSKCGPQFEKDIYYYTGNGKVYLCIKAKAGYDVSEVYSEVQKKEPDGKVYVGSACGAESNSQGGALTWWVQR